MYGFFIIYISFLSKKKGEKGSYINNLANALILITSLTINLVILNFSSIGHKEFIVFPFNILFLGFIGLFLPLFYIFTSREKKKIKRINQNMIKTEYVSIKELPLKYEIYRKLTHLVVLGIIFFYFTLGFLIKNFFHIY